MATTLGEMEFSDKIQLASGIALIIAIIQISEPAVTALIAFFAVIGFIPANYRQEIGAAIIGAFVLNILVGQAVLPMFASQNPDLPTVLASARLAGLIEPITTKVTPALAILLYYRNRSPEFVEQIRESPWFWGAILGWTIGFLEMLMKVSSMVTLYAGVNSLSLVVVFTTVLHLITGFLAAGSMFYFFGREVDGGRPSEFVRGVKMGVLIVGAMVFHYWWNAGGGAWLYNVTGLPS